MKQRLEDFVRECHGRADAGHPESQYDLGILYSTGKGVPLDYIIAHKWFNLAAAASIPEARQLRGDIASQMSKDEVAEALPRRPPGGFKPIVHVIPRARFRRQARWDLATRKREVALRLLRGEPVELLSRQNFPARAVRTRSPGSMPCEGGTWTPVAA